MSIVLKFCQILFVPVVHVYGEEVGVVEAPGSDDAVEQIVFFEEVAVEFAELGFGFDGCEVLVYEGGFGFLEEGGWGGDEGV